MPDFSWPPFGWGQPGAGAPAATPAATTSGDPGYDLWLQSQKSGGSNSIAAPQGQQNVLIPNAKFDPSKPLSEPGGANYPYIITPNPNAAAKPSTTAPTHFGSDDVGYWLIDPGTGQPKMVVPPHTPNADDEMKKAIDRMDRASEISEKEANAAAGRGYQTTADWQKMVSDAQKNNLSAADLQEKVRQFDLTLGQTGRLADAKQKTEDATAAQNILQSKATVGQIEASTAATTGVEQRAAQKFPTDLAQAQSTLQGTNLVNQTAAQALAQGKAPTSVPTPTGMSIWQRDPNTGAMTPQGVNPEFQPKTQAEVMARIGQIQSLMQQKNQEVQGKVGQVIDGKQYTADDALKDFNQWYDANVAPQTDSLQAAQQAAQFKQAQEEAASRANTYQTALGAGTQAISAFNAEAPNRAGPGLGAAMKSIAQGRPQDVDFNAALTYQAPSIRQETHDAVNEALKFISPAAAAATGSPMPQFSGVDIGQALARSRYGGPGGAAPMPYGGGAPPPMQPMPFGGGPPPPMQPMVSSGAVGPWAGGATPPPGTTWSNPAVPDYRYQLQF